MKKYLLILGLFLVGCGSGGGRGDTNNITCVVEVAFDDFREGDFNNSDNCQIVIVGDTTTETNTDTDTDNSVDNSAL